MSRGESFLLLGGAGLTGKQIARRIAAGLSPKKIVIVSLFEDEVNEALKELKQEFADQAIEWAGQWGNVFVRTDYADKSRQALTANPELRQVLFDDLFGGIDDAYQYSRLVQIILEHKPDVIVDSINTATAISYQDVDTASIVAKRELDDLFSAIQNGQNDQAKGLLDQTDYALELLILSQALPQLVRHIQLLYRAMQEVKTRLYLKIGTTGTGGMGLNIPYTHSEDKPSSRLMTKTAVAFAHTGLMFLMARTPGPVVKEIKPGGMIGYADVSSRTIKNKARNEPAYLYSNRKEDLNSKLTLKENEAEYQRLDTLTLPVVDTGENGLFTKGEFEAITSLRQMEFITPEEIASKAILEIRGSNTGQDVIAAIDGGVMNPTYRAGYLRHEVLVEMARLEQTGNTYSVALGQLGPPELSKLLWELELLKIEYSTLSVVLKHSPEDISKAVYKRIQQDAQISQAITSIGVPILTPDGKGLIRGPLIRIPEVPGSNEISLDPTGIDKWAAKGWVDLRPANFAGWQERFEKMHASQQQIRGRGSSVITRDAYLFEDIRIGEIAAWIFNTEEDGYRIK